MRLAGKSGLAAPPPAGVAARDAVAKRGAHALRRSGFVVRLLYRLLPRLLPLARRMLAAFGLTLLPLPPGTSLRLRLDPRRLRWGTGPGLSRRTCRLALTRFLAFRPFEAEDYAALNPDVVGSVPDVAAHALLRGSHEMRPLFRPETLARVLGELRLREAETAAEAADDLTAPDLPNGPVALYCSSRGNLFMREIAEDLAATLAAYGVEVVQRDEAADPRACPRHTVIVAPHEFFLLGRGLAWQRDEVIANAVMLNTEQVQTQWFTAALPYLMASRGVIDLSAQMRDFFEECGLPSLHLTLAPPMQAPTLTEADRRHPLFRVLPPAARGEPDPDTPPEARPIDIAFFGATSPHREALLTRHAAFLAECNCFIYCRRAERPIMADSQEATLTRLARHVSGHARITLNLHRDAFGYFEWHRIVRLGLCTGSVVVSEPCLPHPAFRPGVHYFEETGRHIPNLIEWLLRSEDGRQAARAVQQNARHLLARQFSAERNAAAVLRFLARVA
jgi:hypothetical protein